MKFFSENQDNLPSELLTDEIFINLPLDVLLSLRSVSKAFNKEVNLQAFDYPEKNKHYPIIRETLFDICLANFSSLSSTDKEKCSLLIKNSLKMDFQGITAQLRAYILLFHLDPANTEYYGFWLDLLKKINPHLAFITNEIIELQTQGAESYFNFFKDFLTSPIKDLELEKIISNIFSKSRILRAYDKEIFQICLNCLKSEQNVTKVILILGYFITEDTDTKLAIVNLLIQRLSNSNSAYEKSLLRDTLFKITKRFPETQPLVIEYLKSSRNVLDFNLYLKIIFLLSTDKKNSYLSVKEMFLLHLQSPLKYEEYKALFSTWKSIASEVSPEDAQEVLLILGNVINFPKNEQVLSVEICSDWIGYILFEQLPSDLQDAVVQKVHFKQEEYAPEFHMALLAISDINTFEANIREIMGEEDVSFEDRCTIIRMLIPYIARLSTEKIIFLLGELNSSSLSEREANLASNLFVKFFSKLSTEQRLSMKDFIFYQIQISKNNHILSSLLEALPDLFYFLTSRDKKQILDVLFQYSNENNSQIKRSVIIGLSKLLIAMNEKQVSDAIQLFLENIPKNSKLPLFLIESLIRVIEVSKDLEFKKAMVPIFLKEIQNIDPSIQELAFKGLQKIQFSLPDTSLQEQEIISPPFK